MVVATLGVTVLQGTEPDKPRGILPVVRGIGPATSTPAACDGRGVKRQGRDAEGRDAEGRDAAISMLPNPFELNRILMLSYTICADSSVNSWSKANRSGWRGACCFFSWA